MTHQPDPQARSRRLYGRRRGPALSARRKALIRELLPRVELSLDSPTVPGTDFAAATIDAGALFKENMVDLWVEIGFGMGEHLAAQALAHPTIGFIGCEPYVNGIAGLLSLIDEGGMRNIRIYCDNALNLMEALPAASVGKIFLLHPDPWPKRRHQSRRFVSPGNIDIVARVLRDGGEFRLQTDETGYVRWTMRCLEKRSDFKLLAEGPGGARQRPGDRPRTRYEAKARLSGRRSHTLCFKRLPRLH
ncbi:MAG: tRNA (guanosine(46)-N7)-methyltransferase TrmB [Proteobacteria bacterium]|nr:tRNA (guanosine(46)-N7)-methyltransferase TrmB [Pseudomonadota bacterium]